MRTHKKFIAIILIFAIVSSLIPNLISHAAEPNFTMCISGTTDTNKVANIGDVVLVDVNFTDGLEGQKLLSIVLNYDHSKLELQPDYVDPEEGPQLLQDMSLNGAIAPAATLLMGTIDSEGAYLTYNSKLGITTSGRAATLKFKVLEGGTSDIKFTTINYSTGSADDDGIALSSSSKVTITGAVPMTGLQVTPANVNLNKGKTATLTAVKEPVGTTDTEPITWTTSNSSVATVSNGKVTAIGVGSATITAKCGSFTATSQITADNPLTGLKISQETATVNRGENIQLTATKEPGDTDNKDAIIWATSNSSIATVENGKVVGVGIGNATITATCGSFSKSCEVEVKAPLIGLTLDKTEAGIDKNESVQLTAIKNPIDTTNTETVVWNSENSLIASVDQTGLVTGKAFGETNITAKIITSHGTFTATCKVKVNVHIESIEITNGDIELYKGQTEDLVVNFNPTEFAESKTLVWSSSDETIATVSNGTVTAVAPGTATITAKTVNGKTASVTVAVPEVKATTLTINKNNTSIEKGETETLKATVLPENTTDDTTITWSSDNENIATIDQNGIVTAVVPGTAIIKAQMGSEGNILEATCTVKVTCALQSISLDKTEIALIIGGEKEEEILAVSKNPVDADSLLEDVVWASENEQVATVNQNGLVTAVGPGSAIITATLDGKKVTCSVKVDVALTSVEIENENDTLELKKNQTSQLKPVYTPSNATVIPVATWTSSDETVATVDVSGNVKALKEGVATITVDYGNGITATRKVNVTETHANSVIIDKKVESLNKNETIKLGVIMDPIDSTDDITWTSSDESVAIIDLEGNVKALKAGKITITVTASNGKTDSIEIEIKEVALESIEVTSEDTSVEEGSTTQINIKYNPTDVTDDMVITYETSNEAIATVDSTGKVTAKKAGNVVITVSVVAKQGDGTTKTVTSQLKLNVKEKTVAPGPVPGTPVQPMAPAVAGLTTSPHTGDMNIVALAIMMVVSFAGMIITVKKK